MPWWGEAARSGLMPIANHSWDHHHTCVREAVERGGSGTFHSLRDRAEAELQVRRARDYIAERSALISETSGLGSYEAGTPPGSETRTAGRDGEIAVARLSVSHGRVPFQGERAGAHSAAAAERKGRGGCQQYEK